jgi:glutathione S-transferase
MITLCGFSISNYYNKVKMVLLEKGLPFAEEYVKTGSRDDTVLACTPLGKVPFIRTDRGCMCESQVIIDWIEATHPARPLIPADPWEAAKVRELVTFIDVHVELVARELYPQAFFAGEKDEATATRVRKKLEKNIAGFKRLARFGPYVAGDTFTMADCAAFVSIPLVSLATKLTYGEDLIAAAGIDWKPYSRLVGERPSAQRVLADRKAEQERAAAAKPA